MVRQYGRKANWSEHGSQMMMEGRYHAALQAFENAARAEKNAIIHRLHIVQACIALKDFGKAGEQLTEALRMNPKLAAAAKQLGILAAARAFPADVRFNRAGLGYALDFAQFNRDQMAEAAVYYLARVDPLLSVLERGRREGFLSVARDLCLNATGDLLKEELLQKALGDNIIRMPDLELLLTALRRVFLLELPAERFHDRALVGFIITMMRQCWVNEYVWSTTEEEDSALSSFSVDVSRALAGDPAEGGRVLLEALYRPVTEVLRSVPLEDLKHLRPNAIRHAIIAQAMEYADRRARAEKIVRLAPIADETSRRVAAQYEENPFPRWRSLGFLTDGSEWKMRLSRIFGDDRLSFMDKPFEVLIAGCGTGRQAIASTFAYGPNARITAIDLSAASLAYAQQMAERFKASNLTFIQGDILDLAKTNGFADRFKVIECTGVLHHMADPQEGLRCLKYCLADDGFMLIALYSEMARRRWTVLKDDPEFPGENCDEQALRKFRRSLFARPDAELGSEFKGIQDLYNTSGFRDLILHVSERRFTLPEISSMLTDECLSFRGFFDEQAFDKFKQRFPDETWPGRLERWDDFENQNPNHFVGMYYFWCDKSKSEQMHSLAT